MKMRNTAAVAALVCVAGTAFAQTAADDCGAAPSVGAGTFAFSLAGATNSFSFVGACGASADAEDVWLKLVATTDGAWVIETCGQSGDDTVLAAVSACDGTILVCNDDACGLQSRITVNLTTGQEVFIRIAEFAGGTLASGNVVITAPVPPPPPGNIQVFTDAASFNAAVSSPATDTFDDLPLALVTSPINRPVGPYAYTGTAVNNFFTAGTASDVWLSTNTATSTIVFDSFTGGVFGVSGFFFGSDINGNFVSNPITVSAIDASGIVSRTITADPTTGFLGFRSTTGILSVTVTSVQPTTGVVWPTVNDLTLATGAPTCRPDLNNDGELTFDDISLFVSLYNANDNRADFNNDGEWTFDDISLFVQLYNAGC